MVVSRERIQQLSLFMVDIYNELEMEILQNMGRRLAMGPDMEGDAITSWQAQQMLQLGPLTDENRAIMAKYAGKTQAEIASMINTVAMEAAAQTDAELLALLPEAAATVAPVATSNRILTIMAAFERQARDAFNLINGTVLTESQGVYLEILNRTTARTLAGQITPQQALAQTAKKWADKGLPALVKNGRTYSIEGYVNTVTRSMTQTVTNEMQDARMEEYGVDLFEISSHAGARPKCAPYQGRIFSRSGKSKIYPAFSSTTYGDPGGLFGINCGHRKYPFVHGKSAQTYQPYDKEENDRVYRQSQEQRKHERDIRKAKKELALMQSLGNENATAEASKLVRERQAEMRAFIDKTERRRRYDREKIVSP